MGRSHLEGYPVRGIPLEKGPVVVEDGLRLDARMMSKPRDQWQAAYFNRPQLAKVLAHPNMRQGFVLQTINQASRLSDEDIIGSVTENSAA